MHVSSKRRAKMVGNLVGQVQSKVSQILNKSKGAWKAFPVLKALISRVTDQAQVEAEDLVTWGEIGECSCLSCDYIPRCLCCTFHFCLG